MIQPLLVFGDWGLLILRIVLGIIMIAHGWPKIRNLKATSQDFKKMGFSQPMFWGTIVAILEFVGGLTLIAGFATQLVASFMVIQFIVVILKVKGKLGLISGYEFDLLILAVAVLLATVGGGAYSFDQILGFLLY